MIWWPRGYLRHGGEGVGSSLHPVRIFANIFRQVWLVGWDPHVRFLRVGPACQVGQGQVLTSGTRMRWGWVGLACQVIASGTRMSGGVENNIKYKKRVAGVVGPTCQVRYGGTHSDT